MIFIYRLTLTEFYQFCSINGQFKQIFSVLKMPIPSRIFALSFISGESQSKKLFISPIFMDKCFIWLMEYHQWSENVAQEAYPNFYWNAQFVKKRKFNQDSLII